MAGYYTPTVIQPSSPDTDMTPLELLLLSHMFDSERDGDGWCFCSKIGPSDMIEVDRTELEAALAASGGLGESAAATFVSEHLPKAQSGEPLPSHIDLDLSTTSWEFIVQDIVRRSSTLTYVSAVSSFTCSKMRPDGFGGAAGVISADAIVGKSTSDLLEEFVAQIAP